MGFKSSPEFQFVNALGDDEIREMAAWAAPNFRNTNRAIILGCQYEENRPLWEAYYAAAIAGAVEEGMLIVNKERTAMCVLAKPGQHFSTFDLNSPQGKGPFFQKFASLAPDGVQSPCDIETEGMKRIFDQYGDGRSYESLHALLFGVRADLHNTGVGRRLRALCFEEAAKLGVPIRFACGDDSIEQHKRHGRVMAILMDYGSPIYCVQYGSFADKKPSKL